MRLALALVPAIIGCGPGQFVTEDGPEPLRGALFFAPDSTVTLALQETRQVYLVLANSTLPCAPEDVEDDPATLADETLAARAYWGAQFATAFAREGARVVVLLLSVGSEEDWLGRYPLRGDALDLAALGEYVAADGRAAAGGWYSVEESSVADANGVLYASSMVGDEAAFDLAVDDPAWVDVSAKDAVVEGTFDFTPLSFRGTFVAERCDNTELLTELYQRLGALVLAFGTDEGG